MTIRVDKYKNQCKIGIFISKHKPRVIWIYFLWYEICIWKHNIAHSIAEYAKKIMFAKEGEDV